jgi:hypothetical protein
VEGLPIPRWQGTPDQLRIAELAAKLGLDPGDAEALGELNNIVGTLYGTAIAASA